MPKIIVISAFTAMLILAAHGQTYRALGADPETASVPPGQAAFERQVRNYFEQLERDQAAANAERRAAGISAVPAPAPPNSQLGPPRLRFRGTSRHRQAPSRIAQFGSLIGPADSASSCRRSRSVGRRTIQGLLR